MPFRHHRVTFAPLRGDGPLELKPVDATAEHPFIFEIADDLLLTELLIHLERLPGLEVVAKLPISGIDDDFAAFSYRGQVFEIDHQMGSFRVWAPTGCPRAAFEEVEEHVRNFRRVPIVAFFLSGYRYIFKLPSFPCESDSLPPN